jgi:hypothetical protein
MQEKEDWLMFICSSCNKKNICKYRNKYWYSCEHVKRISNNVLSGNVGYVGDFELRFGKVIVVCHFGR